MGDNHSVWNHSEENTVEQNPQTQLKIAKYIVMLPNIINEVEVCQWFYICFLAYLEESQESFCQNPSWGVCVHKYFNAKLS